MDTVHILFQKPLKVPLELKTFVIYKLDILYVKDSMDEYTK